MSLGLFQLHINPIRRDQLFFSATGFQLATPSLRFLLSRICWKVGAVSRARAFCAAKRTLDTAPSFHRMLLESEGRKTLKAGAFGVTSPFAPPSPSVARRGRAKRTRKLTLAADRPPALFTLRRIKHARWRRHPPRKRSRLTHRFCYRAEKSSLRKQHATPLKEASRLLREQTG